MNKTLAFLLGLISGVVVGTAVASLFVPRSGLETREQVTERGIELKHRAEETVRKAQEVANETVTKVQITAKDLLPNRQNTHAATS